MSVKNQPIWKVEEIPPTFSEDAFYAQNNVLHQSLEEIQYGDFSQSHWYFLGVAGASYQDVFKSEIMRIKEQFDTRFGTFGRSVALVNNPSTRTELPIATRTSIEMSLRRIGQQMNKESDVLFLYDITWFTNQFEIENAPLDLKQVDQNGYVKHLINLVFVGVIVISACYSGSFIPALQSDQYLNYYCFCGR